MDVISPLLIEKIVYGGQGLARHEGKVLFIPYVIGGEKICAKITKSKKNFSNAEVLRIIDSSPHRVSPRCRHFGSCGGCQLQHMDYSSQLNAKKEILKENLNSFIDEEKIQVVGLENFCWNYREHIKLTYQSGKLGYHGSVNKDVFDLAMCPIFSEKLPEALDTLRTFFEKHLICHAEIRLLKTKNSFIAAINCDHVDTEVFQELLSYFQGVTIKCDQKRVDMGDCIVVQEYLGKSFHMDAWSFMQGHRLMAESLYKYVLNHIPSHTQTLLDLYCGAGILSILAAQKNIVKIIGIELNPTAISCAKQNQKSLHAPHVQFMAAPAEHVFEYVEGRIDHVIINPPREGLSQNMIDELFKMKEASFCYVSCNPTTLKRDLKKFYEFGYELVSAQGFDLFPQTTHIETVCIIKKAITFTKLSLRRKKRSEAIRSLDQNQFSY